MSEKTQTNVDVNSPEFMRGVEAGLNSEDTTYWQAGYELGQGLSGKETKEPVKEIIQKDVETPLCLEETLDGSKG